MYFKGLYNIYELTKSRNATLRIDLERAPPFEGLPQTGYALYDEFWIGDRSTDYTLEKMSGYSGTWETTTSQEILEEATPVVAV